MSEQRATFNRVAPIGDTDPKNLPVPDLESALPFYEQALGFTVRSRSSSPHPSAVIARDDVEMVLAENGGDPEQASCYLAVSDVDLAYREFWDRGVNPTDIRTDDHGGKKYRVFFVRAPDGLCFCLGQQV
jgi:predicted enzyme related to lactoylglutathione lyase